MKPSFYQSVNPPGVIIIVLILKTNNVRAHVGRKNHIKVIIRRRALPLKPHVILLACYPMRRRVSAMIGQKPAACEFYHLFRISSS